MGTSPTPNAHSIWNCPGAGSAKGWSSGSSSIVTVFAVSAVQLRTRYRRGTIGPLTAGDSARAAIDVQQLELGGAQLLLHDPRTAA